MKFTAPKSNAIYIAENRKLGKIKMSPYLDIAKPGLINFIITITVF